MTLMNVFYQKDDKINLGKHKMYDKYLPNVSKYILRPIGESINVVDVNKMQTHEIICFASKII